MATKETLDQAEAALDAIEEKLDVLEAPLAEIIEIKRNYGKIAALVLGGAIVGSAITYYFTNKSLSKRYEAQFNQELKDSVTFLVQQANLQMAEDVVEEEVQELTLEEKNEILKELTRTSLEKADAVPEPLPPVDGERVVGDKVPLENLAQMNQTIRYDKMIKDQGYDEGLSETEEELVAPEPIYQDPDISVISRDIFMANGSEFEQEVLQYFSDGGVMDIGGDFVTDVGTMIGEGTPAFGQQSNDANVVYLRNKRLKKEYEIIFDAGKSSDFIAHTNGEEDDDVSSDLMHSLARNVNSRRLG